MTAATEPDDRRRARYVAAYTERYGRPPAHLPEYTPRVPRTAR
ncbi:hypothetical protein ABRQ22_06745 [Cellulosimicrobium sp. ES-005]|uniref:Uncharacterized protein n=1 Tax=Cellulosimicrobium sp. ES-005 TaxID=3163031 RepID=A0AAU8G3H1_9MICO